MRIKWVNWINLLNKWGQPGKLDQLDQLSNWPQELWILELPDNFEEVEIGKVYFDLASQIN